MCTLGYVGYVFEIWRQNVALQNLFVSLWWMLLNPSPAIFFTESGAGMSHILHMGLGFSFVCRPGIRISDGLKLCLNPICQSQNCNWLRIARLPDLRTEEHLIISDSWVSNATLFVRQGIYFVIHGGTFLAAAPWPTSTSPQRGATRCIILHLPDMICCKLI